MHNEVKVLTVNGYSRTGKSTVCRMLAKLGWVKASTTDYLTTATIEYYGLELNQSTIADFTNKQNDGYYLARFGIGTRDMKIHVAESVLVPEYGRLEGLVSPTVNIALKELSATKGQKLLIETVNYSEYSMFVRCLESRQSQYLRFNLLEPIYLERDRMLKGVDLREPFGKAIDNNVGIERTMAEILRYVS